MPRLVGEMETGGNGFDVEDEYARFRRRQRIHCIFEANVKHKIVTKLAQFSLLASGWLCAIMPAFSDRERNARFEDGGIGGPDRGGGGRDDCALRRDRGVCAGSRQEGMQPLHAA